MGTILEFFAQVNEAARTHKRSRPSQKEPTNVGDELSVETRARPKAREAPANRLIPETAVTQSQRQKDLVVLTALQEPEKERLLKTFSEKWENQFEDGVLYSLAEVKVKKGTISVAVASQSEMGMVPATILATKAIRSWRPRYLAMTGICAGVKGKVSLGDIVVAQSVFDYGSGKLEAGRLRPDYAPVPMDAGVCGLMKAFAADSRMLLSIMEGWPTKTGRPKSVLRAHVGAFASGAAVVADEKIVIDIAKHKRSLLGIDMEAYGLAKATVDVSRGDTKFIIAKAVADYADTSKRDDCQEYCAHVSAEFLRRFFEAHYSALFRP